MRWSYAETRTRARDLARGLHALGVRRGDMVALVMNNRPEWLLIDFAVTMLGATLVPMSTWSLGAPPLSQQHDPRPLANGNLLIFDNGPHRRDHPAPYSRVIEVDPRTSAIVWEYRDQSLFDFFSPYISGAQRLPNGNTLICEGCDGRIFEVTSDHQVVWEYVNPHFFMEEGRPGLNNWVFRAFRYTSAEIERARS